MAHFKDNHGFTVKGWMSSRLGLKGTERIVYAIIYGFTLTNECEFYGGHQYLAEAASASIDTIKRALTSLQEKGLIWKAERENDGISRCRYSVYTDENGDGIFCPEGGGKMNGGRVQNAQGGGCKMPPPINNINNNINIKKNNNKKETVEDLFKEDNPEYLFDKWFKDNFPQLAKNDRPLKYKTYINLQSKYTKEQILLKLNAMEAKKNFNKDYCDVGRTLFNWLARDSKPIIKKA